MHILSLLNFKYFYVLFQSRCLLKMLFEMIIMFSQFMENFLTPLLWYEGAKMFLILITAHEKYDYKCQKQFSLSLLYLCHSASMFLPLRPFIKSL